MTSDNQTENPVLDTESAVAETKQLNPQVLKEYEKCQQKYMEVYGRFLVRKNLKKRLKLKERMFNLQEKLKRLEKNLYISEKTNEQ